MENNDLTINIQKLMKIIDKDVLNEEDIQFINYYLEAYNQTLNAYIASSNDPTLNQNVQLLSLPINEIYTPFKTIKETPAVKIIKDFIEHPQNNFNNSNQQGQSNSLSNTRTLTNPKFPKMFSDDNGFISTIIIVSLTIIVGFILGAMLFFLK